MELEELKKKYWDTVRSTRSSGRIAKSVIERVEACWDNYDKEVVRQALEIHISKYPSYKENYTLGIMRNLQRCKDNGAAVKPKNSFKQFQQNDYDFDEIEAAFLAN